MIKKTNGITSRGNLRGIRGGSGTEFVAVGNNRKRRMREDDPKDPTGDTGKLVAIRTRGVARS